jgi:hypothetical protein
MQRVKDIWPKGFLSKNEEIHVRQERTQSALDRLGTFLNHYAKRSPLPRLYRSSNYLKSYC